MKKWEYKLLWTKGYKTLEDELNKLGQQGWEMVGMMTESGPYSIQDDSRREFAFKRLKN